MSYIIVFDYPDGSEYAKDKGVTTRKDEARRYSTWATAETWLSFYPHKQRAWGLIRKMEE